MTALEGWENFYIVVGPSAGALIGLQFVVVTLIADMPLATADAQASGAFTTPSVVHFGVVLLLSAMACVPWSGILPIALVWGLVGFGGLAYTVIVTRRLKKQTIYDPVFEDWMAHAILPLIAYAMLVVSSILAHLNEREGLFVVAGAALLLLFVGIHNAWDTVTHIVFVRKREQDRDPSADPARKE